jgi:hypothetical protein
VLKTCVFQLRQARRIGAGAKLADVHDPLTARGVSIPTGSCLSVGVAGITQRAVSA